MWKRRTRDGFFFARASLAYSRARVSILIVARARRVRTSSSRHTTATP